MKVKFLKDGGWAFNQITKGQLKYKEGEVLSGIPESDARDMKEAGVAEVLGADDAKEVTTDDGGSSDDDTKSDSADAAGENGSNGDDKPWENGE